MAFLKAGLKKAIPLLLALTLCLTLLPAGAAAEEGAQTADPTLIDQNAKGSITVTKYATTGSETGGNATGTKNDASIAEGTYRRLNGGRCADRRSADTGCRRDPRRGQQLGCSA